MCVCVFVYMYNEHIDNEANFDRDTDDHQQEVSRSQTHETHVSYGSHLTTAQDADHDEGVTDHAQ